MPQKKRILLLATGGTIASKKSENGLRPQITPEELISSSHDVDQVCKMIEADSLAFLSHQGMLDAGRREDLCLACFNNEYPTDLYNE